jgi:hypothetical protein
MKKFLLNNMVQGILHYVVGIYTLVTFFVALLVSESPISVLGGLLFAWVALIGYNMWVSDELNKTMD